MGLPSGWTSLPLGDVVDFYSGGTPKKSDPALWGGRIPWVTAKDMRSRRLRNSSTTNRTLTELGSRQLRLVPAGSVLVLVRGMGLFRDLPITHCERPVCFNQDIKSLVPRGGLDSEYLALAMVCKKAAILQHVDNAGHGTGRLDIEFLKSTPIPVPPIAEQIRIVAMVDAWDQAIDHSTAIANAKRIIRRGLTQALVAGTPQVRRESGARWRRVPLNRLLVESRRRSCGSEEVYSVSVSKGLVNQIDHLGRSFAARDTSKYNRVLPGDIVYTRSPTGDFPLGLIKRSTVSRAVIVSPLYGVFTPISEDVGIVLAAWFESSQAVSNYLRPLVQKGAKNTIAIANQRFLEGAVVIPTVERYQDHVARVLEVSEKEIVVVDRQIDKLRLQRRGVIQRLLFHSHLEERRPHPRRS